MSDYRYSKAYLVLPDGRVLEERDDIPDGCLTVTSRRRAFVVPAGGWGTERGPTPERIHGWPRPVDEHEEMFVLVGHVFGAARVFVLHVPEKKLQPNPSARPRAATCARPCRSSTRGA
jgi:hypothetical protein